MKYGCIGKHLKHSFSKEIHARLADYEYEICEIERNRLAEFMENADFSAINVTIPYKELVIPHLYEIDEHAKEIGAVNTVVNRGGRLYGYNTDFYGMTELIHHAGIEIAGKKVLICGTGGTSKTAATVVRALGAVQIIRASRTAKEDAVSYDEVYSCHSDAEIIINTTPVGMFPNISDCPIDISAFKSLSGVIDAIYNPLRSTLILNARERGIPAEGGLYMLVAQAKRASEIFLDTKYSDGVTDEVYKSLMCEKENIVLVGMPGSGKSTVGALLSELLSKPVIDTDKVIEERAGRCISEIFTSEGETAFREYEAEAVRDTAAFCGRIIATGGGAILRTESVKNLRKNGRIYFIDRPLEDLIPTSDRPLASTVEAIKNRYKERYPIYLEVADERIDAAMCADEVARNIKRSFEDEENIRS